LQQPINDASYYTKAEILGNLLNKRLSVNGQLK